MKRHSLNLQTRDPARDLAGYARAHQHLTRVLPFTLFTLLYLFISLDT